VLADHAAYQANAAADEALQRQNRAAELQRLAGGHVAGGPLQVQSAEQQQEEEDDDDGEDDGKLDDFLAQVRYIFATCTCCTYIVDGRAVVQLQMAAR
jgi:hypothetical protein